MPGRTYLSPCNARVSIFLRIVQLFDAPLIILAAALRSERARSGGCERATPKAIGPPL